VKVNKMESVDKTNHLQKSKLMQEFKNLLKLPKAYYLKNKVADCKKLSTNISYIGKWF